MTGCVLLDAGQAHVEALELVGQAAVVDAEAVEDGGVQVVDVDRVANDVVAEVVGLAVGPARLDAAAGHPDGEALGVVVAAVVVLREPALAVDGAGRTRRPRRPGCRRAGPRCLRSVIRAWQGWSTSRHWLGRSPARLPCWSQPRWKIWTNRTSRSASRRASRQLAAKVPGFVDVGAVHVEDVLRLVGDVDQLGDRALHPEGHLVLGDPGLGLGVGGFGEFLVVQPARASSMRRRVAASTPGGFERKSTGSPLERRRDALVLAGQEARAPEPVVDRLGLACGRSTWRSSPRTRAGSGSSLPRP